MNTLLKTNLLCIAALAAPNLRAADPGWIIRKSALSKESATWVYSGAVPEVQEESFAVSISHQ